MPPTVDVQAVMKAMDDINPGHVYFVDRQTRQLISLTVEDKAGLEKMGRMLKSEPTRYTQVPKPQPRENMAEVERFVATVADLKFRDVLKRVLTSHRPFREFKDALGLRGKEKERREWEAFHSKELESRARTFIKSFGLG